MTDWWKDIKRVLMGLATVLGLLFIVFVINQFILLYQFLSLLHPILAIIVLSVIGIGILYFIYSITKQLLKSPKVLELEDDATEEERSEERRVGKEGRGGR